jgi:hypothetical protein|eukprot:COSAG01_NODE_1364_length_10563_cov_7.354931_6_plen_83_part_00
MPPKLGKKKKAADGGVATLTAEVARLRAELGEAQSQTAAAQAMLEEATRRRQVKSMPSPAQANRHAPLPLLPAHTGVCTASA